VQETIIKLTELNAKQAAQIQELIDHNRLLSQKVQFLLKRLFGRKSEKLNSAQMELLLAGMSATEPDDDDPPPTSPKPRSRRKREHKPRMPEDLPTEEQVIIPDAVKQDPSAYQRIGEEVTEELDVVPTRYFRRRIVRPKFKSKANRARPPVIAPLPPRLIEGGYASPGLLTDIILKKYVDHLPLYRQEQILRTRHGIDLSRKTMCDWVRVVADWVTPIYNHIREELRASAYLQIDETPVRYCRAEGGGSAKGYLWVFHHPGGDVLYEWFTSRAADCLDGMLGDFSGTVQSDGYKGYTSYQKKRLKLIAAKQSDKPIDLAACWAHARRKFHEALEECPGQAGWILNQIGMMYQIERELRDKGPDLRSAVRAASTGMILARLERVLKHKLAAHRPTSAMGKAISYAITLWPQLLRFRDDGQLEIDNNLVENAVRPTALGKKNWMFIGHPEAGQRSAILYTLLESCKRHDINPQEYLHDVLSRLPSMTNQQTRSLTPTNWLKERQKSLAA
jgi:transposase